MIVNAFNRERTVARKAETNADLTNRAGRALARAGASITVTSLTDMVAFGKEDAFFTLSSYLSNLHCALYTLIRYLCFI